MTTEQSWHERLDTTFSILREKRDRISPRARVFALEHGLDSGEVHDLFRWIGHNLKNRTDKNKIWLPCVVAATEIGYRFAGDEYWHTFEREIPEWKIYGDSSWIRASFEKFCSHYKGVEPSGAWANHFRIIAWPVTNAILPLDLQWQFLQAIYKIRLSLRDEHFEDEELLARTIEARTLRPTDRFQNFLKNRELVWQFTSALLTENLGENRELLLENTLRRIVTDLERENSLREWLKETRHQAQRLIVRGAKADKSTQNRGTQKTSPLSRFGNISPRLHLNPGNNRSYDLYALLPDFRSLLSSDPELKSSFQKLRYQVLGSYRSGPLPSAYFLSSRRLIRLATWPEPSKPLLEAPNCDDDALLKLLNKTSISSSRTTGLFKIRADGLAVHVKGGTLRPGAKYVLVLPEGETFEVTGESVQINCPGMKGLQFEVPDSGEIPFSEKELRRLGLCRVSYLDIRPVGVSPSQWDEEGFIEWLSTDTPLIALKTNKEVDSITFQLDGLRHTALSIALDDAKEMFIELPKLYTGSYELNFISHSRIPEFDKVSGMVEFIIREPNNWSKATSPCNPLLVYTDPVNPSYEELLSGCVNLDLQGPLEKKVIFQVSFYNRKKELVYSANSFEMELPVKPDNWNSLFSINVLDHIGYGKTDVANICEVSIVGEELGDVTLRFERHVSALRWTCHREERSTLVQLIDDTDSFDRLHALFYDVETPDVPTIVDYKQALDGLDHRNRAGLYYGRANGNESSLIVTIPGKSLTSFNELKVSPSIESDIWNLEKLPAALKLIAIWVDAKIPDDFWANQLKRSVVMALTRELFGVFGGDSWKDMENQYDKNLERIALKKMLIELKHTWHYNQIAHYIWKELDIISELTTYQRNSWFASAMENFMMFDNMAEPSSVKWISEFCLRLASESVRVLQWAGEKSNDALKIMMKRPVILLLARYVVLSVDERLKGRVFKAPGILYTSWEW